MLYNVGNIQKLKRYIGIQNIYKKYIFHKLDNILIEFFIKKNYRKL